MTTPLHERERRKRVLFSVQHGLDPFKPVMSKLNKWWQSFRETLYPAGNLALPAFDLEAVPPRSLAVFDQVTGDGVEGVIRIHRRIALGTDPRILNHRTDEADKAPGFDEFLRDCLLHAMNHQVVAEALGIDEGPYHGYGPAYAREANRCTAVIHATWDAGDPLTRGPQPWGNEMTVVAFRRSGDSLLPAARNWPFCLRPEHYYGDTISGELESKARGTSYAARRKPLPPSQGLLRYLLWLHREERFDRAAAVLSASVKLLDGLAQSRRPALRLVEQGRQHPNGKLLNLESVVIDPAWLKWNNHLVAATVRGIDYYHSFAELPILADMLDDAGCEDKAILDHCRAEREHTSGCWVVAKLLAASQGLL